MSNRLASAAMASGPSLSRQARLQRDLESITAFCTLHQFLQGESANLLRVYSSLAVIFLS